MSTQQGRELGEGPVEIERKFLVTGAPWEGWGAGVEYRQGYLSRGAHSTTRVRVAGARGLLTVKGKTVGVSRLEFEYEIPLAHARALLALCEGDIISKRRWCVEHEGHTWELDVFEGANEGLVVAEIELSAEDEVFARPPWLGREVSDDPRYTNGALSRQSWRSWGA